MSSSEEYLDSLLRALTEGNSHADAIPATDISETENTDAAGGMLDNDADVSSAGEEHHKVMDMNDIEAMFASMGENAEEEVQSDGLTSDMGLMPEELPTGLEADENMLSDDMMLNGSLMPEQGMEGNIDDFGPETGENADDFASELTGMTDDFASEELPEGVDLDEGGLLDDFALDENLMSEPGVEGNIDGFETETGENAGGFASEELSEGLGLDEGAILDDFALDENQMPEELEQGSDKGGLLDDFALDENLMSEELEQGSDEGAFLDDFALDENLMPEELEQGSDEGELLEDFALDENLMPEEAQGDIGGFTPDMEGIPEGLMEEELPEGLEADEGGLLDDFVLDESLMPEEPEMTAEEQEDGFTSEAMTDELEADEGGLLDDFALDESLMPEELEPEASNDSDDLALDDIGLDDLNLDDLGMDDSGQMEEDAESDDVSVDDFALKESGEDDDDLSALLAGMGSDDDLAEINDLLEKADKGMSEDDDMLAMLGEVSGDEEGGDDYNFFGEDGLAGQDADEIREITPEEIEERENSKKSKKERKRAEKEKKKAEKERQKKEKLEGKRRKKEGAPETEGEENEDAGLEDLLGGMDLTEEKPKKQGFFGRLMTALLEEEEDEDEELAGLEGDANAGAELASLSDENKELLAELKAEDKKNAKKKDKKEKKSKKGKKGGEGGAEGEGEEEVEVKRKKPKKEKKKKEKNVEEEFKEPEKKLSKKKVTSVFLFCATIAACIILLSMLLPTQFEKQEARVAYDYGQYEQVYDLLYGKKLSEEDESLLQKSSIILQTRRKLESYENYTRLNMPLEALNALLEGVGRYHNLRDEAEQYRISDELYDVYEQILTALSESYGVSEAEALEILSAGDDVTYSQKVEAIVYGSGFGEEENLPEVKQDVLPEEEEIIDRLKGAEEAEEPQQTDENTDVMQAEEEL